MITFTKRESETRPRETRRGREEREWRGGTRAHTHEGREREREIYIYILEREEVKGEEEKAVGGPGRSETSRVERAGERREAREKGERGRGERGRERRNMQTRKNSKTHACKPKAHASPKPKGQKKGGGERGRVACARTHNSRHSPPPRMRTHRRARCRTHAGTALAPRALSGGGAPPGAKNPAALRGPPSANRASDGDAARMKKCPFRPGGRAGGLPA